MNVSFNQRFLRDGVLDGMIKRIREIDKQNWTLEKMAIPTTAVIIELFELNRLLLKNVERYLDEVHQNDPEWYDRLLPLAHEIQEGLRNAFHGLEDEWDHFVEHANNI